VNYANQLAYQSHSVRVKDIANSSHYSVGESRALASHEPALCGECASGDIGANDTDAFSKNNAKASFVVTGFRSNQHEQLHTKAIDIDTQDEVKHNEELKQIETTDFNVERLDENKQDNFEKSPVYRKFRYKETASSKYCLTFKIGFPNTIHGIKGTTRL